MQGHSNEQLALLEELLTHDAGEEPVAGRVALWREHRLLLEADPLLRSYLVPPADIDESTDYWQPLPKTVSSSGGKLSRRVSFRSTITVFEFERKVFGGGGMPDDDATALGLGPKLMSTSEIPLQEKDGKDAYGSFGYLGERARAKLLAQFASPEVIQKELDSYVSPLLERTRRERAETRASPEEQWYMPRGTQGSHGRAVHLAICRQRQNKRSRSRIIAS